ncbi:hypothetical protein LTR53_007231 [Teratosphaeriaceae sp. CCFEE 6253]|nr:hypothetical protein LTR53_007231 [Teratosphaeriaceae sp. CCFEE 6253]
MAALQGIEATVTEWRATRDMEQRRDTLLFGTLFTAAKSASEEQKTLREKCDRLDRESTTLFTELEESRRARAALEAHLDLKSSIVVLIDGDNMNFSDHYIAAGAAGGRRVAIDLYNLLVESLTQQDVYKSYWTIMVRIYVNMDGLAATYRRAGASCTEASFRAFIKGFNKERMLFEFVDAGDDKEAADRKIQANVDFYWSMPQCKHVILGCSGDRGYGGFLRQYTQSEEQQKRLILLEGQPFTRELAEVAARVKIIQAPELFRTSPLGQAGVERSTTAPRADSASPTRAGTVVVAPARDGQVLAAPSLPVLAGPSSSPRPTATIKYNRAGHRIDMPVPYDTQISETFMNMHPKPCYEYYLRECRQTFCGFNHGLVLTPARRNALLNMGRRRPCWLTTCKDASCYFGHRCSRDGFCNRGATCKFPDEMHNVDTNVATTI